MPRTRPPQGEFDRLGALAYLKKNGVDISESMLYRYAGRGEIKKSGKWFTAEALNAFIKAQKGEALPGQPTDAVFAPATLADMEEVTRIAAKLFRSSTLTPISTLTRQMWIFKEPRGHYVVKRADGSIVAYLHIVALLHERIEQYMRGEVYGRNITGEDVQKLEPGKPLSCIVVSIGTDPAVEQDLRSRYVSVLLRGVEHDLAKLGSEGVIISRLYAFSESKDGRSLCAHMGMQQYAPPQGRRCTFVLGTLTASTPLLHRYQENLHTWLNENPLHLSQAATMPVEGSVHAEPIKLPSTPIKRTNTRHKAPPDTIPDRRKSLTDMCIDHGIPETSARHGLEDGSFTVIHGRWYARGRIVKTALTPDEQRKFIDYVRSNANFKRCDDERCPCHQ